MIPWRARTLLLLGALAVLPVAAPPAAAEPDRSDAPRAGPEAVKMVFAEMGRLENEALQQYVEAVGQRVARAAPRIGSGYRFFVVDQWTPNAFALPDGSIFVSRGILALASSEEELANVLAHEITHVTQRHAIGRMAVADSANPFLIGFARAAYLASFSRDQERDADRGGQALAAAAGYDPGAMAAFLRKLEYVERIQLGASRLPTFFDTHPATAERAGSTFDRGEKIPFSAKPGIAGDAEAYAQKLDGLPIGDDPAQGIFRGSRFLHPDLDFAVTFPDAWTLVNTARAVGAVAPRGEARIALEFAGQGDDAEAVARKYLAKEMKDSHARIGRSGPVSVAGRSAFEVEVSLPTQAGTVVALLTFLPHEGTVYLISLAARAPSFSSYRGRAAATVRSLRKLDPAERETIDVMRLRLARAEAGESLRELSRRTKNVLDLQRTAVHNGVFTVGELEEGQLVRIAVSERYVPREPAVAAPPP